MKKKEKVFDITVEKNVHSVHLLNTYCKFFKSTHPHGAFTLSGIYPPDPPWFPSG